jgi:hypothetical protein
MTVSITNTPIVEARFQQLFVDLKVAKQQLADENAKPASKKIVPSRELLAVEKRAREDQKANREIAEDYLSRILAKLHGDIEKNLSDALADQDSLISKVLNIDPVISQILDLLSLKACTISRLEVLAAQVPWLYKDLLKMISSPKYRRTDSKGKILTADTLRVALSFFGLENLKMIVPFLIIRRCLPQITDPYPQIKRRVWEHSIATAMSSKRLAGFQKVSENQAFTAGMLQSLGTIAVVKLYFRIFDRVQLEALKESQKTLEHQRHDALTKVEPSSDMLLSLIDKHAAQATSTIIQGLGFQRLFLHSAFEQIANTDTSEEHLPLTKVLLQANAYAKYRILKFHELVTIEEAKEYLRQYKFPMGSLEVLKTTDMRSIGLEAELEE